MGGCDARRRSTVTQRWASSNWTEVTRQTPMSATAGSRKRRTDGRSRDPRKPSRVKAEGKGVGRASGRPVARAMASCCGSDWVIRAPCIAGARRPRSSTRSAATGDGDQRLVPQPVLRAACGPKSVGISQLGGVGLEPSVGQRRGLADRGVSGRVLSAALSHPDRVADELASWARARGLESSGAAATVPELSARLRVGLRDKRMLLLLDDVWEVAHAEPFRPGSQGSSPQRWTRMR
jgi:hypothetical protein